MATTMSGLRIAELNRRAGELAGKPAAPLVGLYRAAEEAGLRFVRYVGGYPHLIGTSGGPQCEVYRDPGTGELVNLRIEGDGLGFDDQIDDPAEAR